MKFKKGQFVYVLSNNLELKKITRIDQMSKELMQIFNTNDENMYFIGKTWCCDYELKLATSEIIKKRLGIK